MEPQLHGALEDARPAGADFLFVVQPKSHSRLHELLHEDFTHSADWLKTRNLKRQVESHCFR